MAAVQALSSDADVVRARRTTAVVAVAVFVVHAAVVVLVRDNGWDDGSITLAFARTLADHGRVALTPLSQEVEGFSSVAWLLLMAVAARLGLGDFDTLIRTSQLAAALCAALAAGVFCTLTRRLVGRVPAAALAVALFCSAPFLNESMNGMEMSLLACAALGIAALLSSARAPRHDQALFALAFVAALVRFEAVGYVVGAALLLWLVTRAKQAVVLAAGAVVAFAVQAAVRAAYFGTLLPNTVTAKRHAPYAAPTLRSAVGTRIRAAGEPFSPLLLAIAVLLVLLVVSRRQIQVRRLALSQLDTPLVFAIGYVLVVWGFNALIGLNWGYQSRMQLSALPLAAFAAAALLRQVGVRWGTGRVVVLAGALLLGSLHTLQWYYVAAAVDPQHVMEVTPAQYRRTGRTVEEIRRDLHQESISFLTPDVGGSSLCCPDIRVLDLGLLANPDLAPHGYAGLRGYLAERRPDVIEVHSLWSENSHIYELPEFTSGYRPVVIDATWLWVRRDLAARLPTGGVPPSDASTLRYRGDHVDEDFLRSFSTSPVYVP